MPISERCPVIDSLILSIVPSARIYSISAEITENQENTECE